MSNIVKPIPQVILDECPLPEGYAWHPETTARWASLYEVEEDAWGFVGVDWGQPIAVTFGDSGSDRKTQKCDSFEHALRYLYAQFLFNGPTT